MTTGPQTTPDVEGLLYLLSICVFATRLPPKTAWDGWRGVGSIEFFNGEFSKASVPSNDVL